MHHLPGEIIGPFTLLSRDGVKWKALCSCGEVWNTKYSSLLNRDNCPSCAPKRTFSHCFVGQEINGSTLLEYLPSKKWRVRCQCGAERICSPADLRRYNACKACVDYESQAEKKRIDPVLKEVNYKIRYYKKHASERDLVWNLSHSNANALFLSSCAYCGKTPSWGIDRVDNTLGYTQENSVPCCAFCNHAKRDYTKDYFLLQIQTIFEYQFRDHPVREYTQVSGNMKPL